MVFKQKQKLVMIGDSITDCGRLMPVGEGKDALGNGYVMMVDALLTLQFPELFMRVVNMGIGGNTVRHLDERWETDIIDLKPDWVSILVGINDVWRQFDSPTRTEDHIPPEEFSGTLERLITKTKPLLSGGIVLMTPFIMDTNKNDPMRARMDEYAGLIRETAAKHGCILCDLPPAFDAMWNYMHPVYVAWDRIHPNHIGSMLIAREFLRSVGA